MNKKKLLSTARMTPLHVDFAISESDKSGAEGRSEVSRWLKKFLSMKMNTVKNPAVIFDIDSTLLEGREANVVRIEKIYDIFEFCQQNRIDCDIVTARLDFEQGWRELRKVMKQKEMNVSKFRSTHMRPGGIKPSTKNLTAFKHSCRERICNEYRATIIANIGDNWHDLLSPASYPNPQVKKVLNSLEGDKSYVAFFPGHLEVSIKLPNDI